MLSLLSSTMTLLIEHGCCWPVVTVIGILTTSPDQVRSPSFDQQSGPLTVGLTPVIVPAVSLACMDSVTVWFVAELSTEWVLSWKSDAWIGF